jgi:hypothetical protein
MEVNAKYNFNLSFFRISIGFIALLSFLTTLPDFNYLFGYSALIPNNVNDLFVSDLVITTYKICEYLDFLDEGFILYFLLISYVILCLMLIVGFLTNITSFIISILHIILFTNNVFFLYGFDYFLSISFFFLIFFPSNYVLSLDNIYNLICKKFYVNVMIYIMFFRIFIGISYFFSGFDKIIGYNWRNGESIWKAFNLPYANLDFLIPIRWILDIPYLAATIGWSIIIFELTYSLINIKILRRFYLFSIIIMHLGIALILNLYFFSSIMIIWNLVNYYNFKNAHEINFNNLNNIYPFRFLSRNRS